MAQQWHSHCSHHKPPLRCGQGYAEPPPEPPPLLTTSLNRVVRKIREKKKRNVRWDRNNNNNQPAAYLGSSTAYSWLEVRVGAVEAGAIADNLPIIDFVRNRWNRTECKIDEYQQQQSANSLPLSFPFAPPSSLCLWDGGSLLVSCNGRGGRRNCRNDGCRLHRKQNCVKNGPA